MMPAAKIFFNGIVCLEIGHTIGRGRKRANLVETVEI